MPTRSPRPTPSITRILILAVLLSATGGASAGTEPVAGSIDVATFTADGELARPADLDQWVFLGASLGMGYNKRAFDPKSPGQIQVVLMERAAYQRFLATGSYPDGAMFLLSFYDSAKQASLNRSGFTQGELTNFEIHLIDRRRGAEGHYFYPFAAQASHAPALPKGNDCVQCHLKNGAFTGTFAQFYPVLRERISQRADASGSR